MVDYYAEGPLKRCVICGRVFTQMGKGPAKTCSIEHSEELKRRRQAERNTGGKRGRPKSK